MQVAGGILTLAVAGTIEGASFGTGTAVAIALGFIGSDNIAAGISRMLTDKEVTTLGEDVIAWSGLVPITELSNLLKSKLNHISNDIFTIDKQYNKEFNETNAQDFPDGFFITIL
ncbi:hypothetical protein FcAc13_02735 [Frischella sp. Ac13]|uniref:Uncharacterized protein n=2 Tax=Frischella TaxID=1335631 RepID=A0ABR7QVG9_9GAMM|nr:hypothetical protein [Frischella japonica]MBC9130222.1 hypothetical protein [Frischella japonica]